MALSNNGYKFAFSNSSLCMNIQNNLVMADTKLNADTFGQFLKIPIAQFNPIK